MLPLRVPPGFRIIAHRGASGYAPENTLAAFHLAERMGATEVELDVQFSKDRQIIICHDETLARYGYPGLRVAELTLQELLALDMGTWFSPYLYGGERLLAFDTLLGVFRHRFIYHVEIKSPSDGLPRAVLDSLTTRRLNQRSVVTSFYNRVLIELRRLAPDLRVGWLVRAGEFTTDNISKAAEAGFFQICPRAAETCKDIVGAAHARLPEVRAWGVNGIIEMTQVVESGCDGLTINWPDWLIH